MAESYRVKLTIGEVKPKRTGTGTRGPFEAMDFMALTPAGAALKYGIFNKKELFPFIVQGAVIDAEVIDKPSGNYDQEGNEFINHNVMNIYTDGKPVVQPRQQGGGYQQRPDNSASIERQTAFKGVIELMVGKVISLDTPLAQKAMLWALSRLSDGAVTPTATIPVTAPPASKTTKETQAVDLDWLKKQLDFLQANKVEGWSNTNLLAYLKNAYKVEGKKISEAVSQLKPEQSVQFTKEVNEAVSKVQPQDDDPVDMWK